MRRSCGMTYSPRLHQGLRVWLRPWLNIWWLHGDGTSRFEGRGCAHPLPQCSTSASFLLIRRQRGQGRAALVCGLPHTLQRVGEAADRRKWDAQREALEIKASPLVCAFLHKTDKYLMMVSIKCCWEPTPRTLHHQRDNSPTAHIISYLDELAVCLPTNEAWDETVWPTMAVTP